MYKRVLVTGIGLLLLTLIFTPVSAQVPYIGVYFNSFFDEPNQKWFFTEEQMNCPPGGGFGTLYIALMNANVFVSGAEYKIEFPPSIIWIADLDVEPPTTPTSVILGSSPIGISMGFGLPRNGGFPVPLQRVLFQWNCSGCSGIANDPIVVKANPFTGDLAYTDWPGFGLFQVTGLTSLVCATIATEETTWGRVKALYK